MGSEKQWYESKGVWGGIVTVLAVIAGAAGYSVSPEAQQELVVYLSGAASAVGGLLSWYGRVVADKRISTE